MRYAPRVFFLVLVLGVFAVPTSAAPEGWHDTVEDGVEAAAKSGKPLLLITAWKRKL